MTHLSLTQEQIESLPSDKQEQLKALIEEAQNPTV